MSVNKRSFYRYSLQLTNSSELKITFEHLWLGNDYLAIMSIESDILHSIDFTSIIYDFALIMPLKSVLCKCKKGVRPWIFQTLIIWYRQKIIGVLVCVVRRWYCCRPPVRLSVRPSHREALLNGSRNQNTFRTVWYSDVSGFWCKVLQS